MAKDVGSIRPWDPGYAERMRLALAAGLRKAGASNYRANDVSGRIFGLLDFVPGVGDVKGAVDTVDAYNAGDMTGAGIGAAATLLGVVPVVGDAAGKAVKKAAGKKAEKKVQGLLTDALQDAPAAKGKAPSGLLGDGAVLTKKELAKLIPATEPDMARSFGTDERLKGGGTLPAEEVQQGLANRARYRSERQVLPKRPEEMSDQEWVDFGAQYGADFSQSPMVSLGVSDLNTRREVMVPGGLDGKFTIPDLFRIKANNFDPAALDQDTHNALMKKFIRTYERAGEHDPVDTFNDLNFALLSPNAPLTQNEFLAQRLRVRDMDELRALAARKGEAGLADAIDAEAGVGAASRGGMGVKGTAALDNQATLASLLLEKPEMFHPHDGETLRDVGFRVMNQVPGLSVKTASLGIPWTDLSKANTSAVDLHIIRNKMERLAQESPDFRERLSKLEGKVRKDGAVSREKAAIDIIGGGHPEKKYRLASGKLHPELPAFLRPEKLAYEPDKFTMPNEHYLKVMDYVDESRGPTPEIELFPEQWRVWDGIRGRVEPHEMAHPDWRKLPRQSFNEMQDALQEHRRLGYMAAPPKDPAQRPAVPKQGDWRKLYYGKADVGLLPLLAALGAGGLYAQGRASEEKP